EVPGNEVEGEEKTILEGELEKKRAKLHILDFQSEVNLPEVRWSVTNAMTDMSIPSHRHLVEQHWRKDGDLDLLMERLHQMNVIPDVLPVIHPSIDLHVSARLMPQHFDALMERNKFQRRVNTSKDVIPGNYLIPQQTRVPPKLYANVFHTDVRLYTMLLVDPGAPTLSTFWVFTALTTASQVDDTALIRLIRTRRYRRPRPRIDVPVVTMAQRLGFDVRAFVKRYGLKATVGGGAHMFREVWDKYVGAVYRYELCRAQPIYGCPPRPDPQRETHSAPTRRKYRIDA
ncbi:hypothetical protein B0H16DRAFT_1756544, partial [Mycena metata]